jgi:predicted dehydrogenase/threonine dehydrogenase-like Zn-dependent dehydrogenase
VKDDMKQVVQDIGSGETKIVEIPVPDVQPRMALVRNHASLVSAGTERALVEFASKSLVGKATSRPDLVRQVLDKARREGLLTTIDAVKNRLDQPLPLGYSSAGTIVALGEEMEGFQAGDRVACAGGGYAVHAEYVLVPRNLLTILPKTVDFKAGAFATMGAIALHGFRLGEVGVRDRVAVIGMGLLGLLTASIAQAAGCAVMGIDVDPERVDQANMLGFQTVLRKDAEEGGLNFTEHQGFDLVQICADTPSNDTVELAGVLARDRGVVVATGVVGTHLPRKLYYEKELRFHISRSYGPGRYDPSYEQSGEDYPYGYVRWTEGRNMKAFLELIDVGSIDVSPLITHEFPIKEALKAYELISGKGEAPYTGVLLTYPDSPAAFPERQITLQDVSRPTESGVKLGVLGAGNFASTVMLPAIKRVAGIELVGIVSASGRSATQAGKRFNFNYAATDAEKMIQDDDLNTLAILTRHHQHAPYVIAGLKAGKHVFCEKPLALDHAELNEIQTVLATSSRLLTVGFNRRFAPHTKRLRALLRTSKAPLAMQYRINAGVLPATHWLHDPEQGGGRIVGEVCHFIDLLAFLCDSLPASVSASALPTVGDYIEDNVSMTLTFEDGSIGTVSYFANGDRSLPKERLEVFQSGRVGILDDFRNLTWIADGRKRAFKSRLRQDKGHQGEWEAFVNAILHTQEPPIPYDQLFAVTRATFAAVQALRSGDPVSITTL